MSVRRKLELSDTDESLERLSKRARLEVKRACGPIYPKLQLNLANKPKSLNMTQVSKAEISEIYNWLSGQRVVTLLANIIMYNKKHMGRVRLENGTTLELGDDLGKQILRYMESNNFYYISGIHISKFKQLLMFETFRSTIEEETDSDMELETFRSAIEKDTDGDMEFE